MGLCFIVFKMGIIEVLERMGGFAEIRDPGAQPTHSKNAVNIRGCSEVAWKPPSSSEIPESIIYEEFCPELSCVTRVSMCPPRQSQVSFGRTWFWRLHSLEPELRLQVRCHRRCPVMALWASCVQRSFQKDTRSSPETTGWPTCPRLPGSGFVAISLRPDDCLEPPLQSAWCSWEMLPHAWDSRGATKDALPRAALALPPPWLISFHANKKEIFAEIIK